MLKLIFFVSCVLALNYRGNISLEAEYTKFAPCEKDWRNCVSTLYYNLWDAKEYYHLTQIYNRMYLIRGLLYYGVISPEYTDGQILSSAYIIVPHILKSIF